jgi:Flp pilus assembly protein TadG
VLTFRARESAGQGLNVRLRRRNDDGAAAVEFALIMIPFFILIAAVIQFGWYFYVAQNSSGAVSTVARKLEVGDCWNGSDAQIFARAQAPQISGLTKSPAVSAAPSPGTTFSVTVTADANLLGFLPMPNGGIISKTVTAQVEDDQATSC